MFTHTTQCMRGVLDPPVSTFSLSLYRHPFLYTLFSSRFTLIINNKWSWKCLWVSEKYVRISHVLQARSWTGLFTNLFVNYSRTHTLWVCEQFVLLLTAQDCMSNVLSDHGQNSVSGTQQNTLVRQTSGLPDPPRSFFSWPRPPS